MQVQGRKALVTGASGGIGRSVVRDLLAAGVRSVVATDLREADLQSVSALDAARVRGVPLDVTDEAGVAALAQDQNDVDILINCHGLAVHQSYLEAVNLTAFRREMEVNYWGQVLTCRAFAPVIGRAGSGALVNFLSPLAYVTFPFVAAYCATKAACRVLTEAMRAELEPKGTLVMAVFPGSIDTPMMTQVNVPKSGPESVSRAVIEGLIEGAKEVWAGEGAQDMRAMLDDNPAALYGEAAKHLRLSDINAAGAPVSSEA